MHHAPYLTLKAGPFVCQIRYGEPLKFQRGMSRKAAAQTMQAVVQSLLANPCSADRVRPGLDEADIEAT